MLGISPAATSLARLTVREPVRDALDLGTGCGVQALHLATHADRVVATDVNQRALWVTRFNLALNDVPAGRVDVREGSFFEPVAGEAFDLITTNPPFVISPATEERLVYRDSGLPGDRAVEHVVTTAPDHLRPGGWCQVLANWVVARGQPWDERLAGWIPDDCDALVVQRETLDPAAYVELWLKDAGRHGGPAGARRYDEWLGWFDRQGVEAIGFGWVNLRRRDGGTPHRELLDWPYEIEQPIGPAIAEWAADRDWLPDADADLLSLRLVTRDDVLQETRGAPGAEDPESIVLRRQRGLRRAEQVTTAEAALVGACDGDLSVGRIVQALAVLLDREASGLVAELLPRVRALAEHGFVGGSRLSVSPHATSSTPSARSRQVTTSRGWPASAERARRNPSGRGLPGAVERRRGARRRPGPGAGPSPAVGCPARARAGRPPAAGRRRRDRWPCRRPTPTRPRRRAPARPGD